MTGKARILIAGAGIGGLALAQALRHGGLDVTVYERDPTPKTRNQGYRLHIDPNGNAALRTCLPVSVLDRVRDTSGINGDLVAAYTHRLEPVMTHTFPGIPSDEITHVDRDAFRQGLLTGDSPAVAEEFAKADPYVVNGVVKHWYIREWVTVAGAEAATPVKPAANEH